MRRILLFFFGLSVFSLNAQQSIADEGSESLYQQAMESYRQESYQSAATLFQQYLNRTESPSVEARYYAALSKLKSSDQSGLTDIKRFIADEPQHPLAGGANFLIGNHFFAKGDYEQAIAYYELVSRSQLNIKDQEEMLFKSGYAYLETEDVERAKTNFGQAIDFRGAYMEDASYYLGVIYYRQKNYNEALAVLEPIDKEGSEYSGQVSMLIASCYFETRSYTRLYAYAEPKLKKVTGEGKKELNRLLGEAYYEQKKFENAAPYLQRYIDLNRRTTASTYYKLGMCYFKLDQNKNAIEYFKLSGLDKGELGQLSSFYLGQLYMKENNLNYAYSAFKKVTEGTTNPEMVEESYVTLAKINYQRNQFADAVSDFNTFLSKYPNSRYKLESNELLAQSYLKSSNYDQALAHLESIPNKSTPLKRAYQKVAFQKGQLLFNDSKFQRATEYFDKAAIYAMDKEITAQAYYLKGECLSVLNQYDQAQAAYKKCMDQRIDDWTNKSRYGLGYISYNEKDYKSAEKYFQDFIMNSFKRDELTVDARLRLADCFYVQKDYDRAIKQYGEVTQPEYASYISYQLGLAYQLKGETTKAIQSFDKTIADNRSAFADNAYFQKGKIYVASGDFKSAVPVYKSMLSAFPESNLIPYAKTDLALCYLNLNDLSNAKQYYTDVLDNHMNHEVANDALLGLQEVIKKGEKVKDFEQYMDKFQAANPDDGSLEVVAFENAKASYYNQEYSEAIRKLTQFNNKYPNSGFAIDALYFQADSYLRMEDWKNAVAQFKKVIDQGSSSYLMRSLDKRGKAYLEMKDYSGAINNYQLLKVKASNRKELYQSQEGLMTAYFQRNDLDSALYYADEILAGDWKPGNIETDTWLIKGRIYYRQKSYSLAMDEFIKVANEAQNENGAEAKYMIGKVYHDQLQFKRSLEVLFDMNKNYGSYPYWIGKSFLLIADDYLEMGELLQAEATTKSIIENATIPEIVKEAREKMEKIKRKTEEVIVSEAKGDSIK
ncbi:tetratricopeptide repeat protein [Marinoscillum pacificum]|uniref:tetratricopeptide repeat protein n=1 Tax=Marinoscillum pacificum TaxID=392723 RepID=UPI00215856A1|nr:tetratricopeptide repeat protein [Marinoscillum pacificum]